MFANKLSMEILELGARLTVVWFCLGRSSRHQILMEGGWKLMWAAEKRECWLDFAIYYTWLYSIKMSGTFINYLINQNFDSICFCGGSCLSKFKWQFSNGLPVPNWWASYKSEKIIHQSDENAQNTQVLPQRFLINSLPAYCASHRWICTTESSSTKLNTCCEPVWKQSTPKSLISSTSHLLRDAILFQQACASGVSTDHPELLGSVRVCE